MRSGRNVTNLNGQAAPSLADWEMRSGRNGAGKKDRGDESLADWEMRSGRNPVMSTAIRLFEFS